MRNPTNEPTGTFARTLFLGFTMLFIANAASAESVADLKARSQAAAQVILNSELNPELAIPTELLKSAKCIATIPGVVRAGLILGGSFGRGLVSCRTGVAFSDPVFFSLSGASWGLQIGIDTTDLIMIFVGPTAIESFSQDNINLGADISIVAGPNGRNAHLSTDNLNRNAIYSYSVTHGLFAGITLNGGLYSVNHEDNALLYGPKKSARAILATSSLLNALSDPYILALEKTAL